MHEDGIKSSGIALIENFISLNNSSFLREDTFAKLKSSYLTKYPIPKSSLLGIDTSQAYLFDIEEGFKNLPGIKPGIYSRADALSQIAALLHKDFFSDFFLDDRNVTLTEGSVSHQLEQITQEFQTVVKIDDKALLARYIDFADRRMTEAKYPLYENCIAEKLKNKKLKPKTFFEACSLDVDKFKKISDYSNKNTNVDFKELKNRISYGNGYQPEFMLMGMIAALDISKLISETGIPFENLTQELQDAIREDNYVRMHLQNKPLPTGAYFCIWPDLPTFDNDFNSGLWGMKLVWPAGPPPGLRRNIVDVESILDVDFSDYKK